MDNHVHCKVHGDSIWETNRSFWWDIGTVDETNIPTVAWSRSKQDWITSKIVLTWQKKWLLQWEMVRQSAKCCLFHLQAERQTIPSLGVGGGGQTTFPFWMTNDFPLWGEQTTFPFWGTNSPSFLGDKQLFLFGWQITCPYWGKNSLSFLEDKQPFLFRGQTTFPF